MTAVFYEGKRTEHKRSHRGIKVANKPGIKNSDNIGRIGGGGVGVEGRL